MKAMVLNGPNLPFELDRAARSGGRPRRGGGARHHLRRRPDHPARQGRAAEGPVPAHHRPRDHRRDRRDRPGRARAQGRRSGDHLFLSQLRPLPLVPDRASSRCARTAAARSDSNATAPMPNTSSCRRRTSSSCRKASTTEKHPAEIGVVTDALATPYKVLRRARVKAGETVAVIGAGGGLGIHQVMMAKWATHARDRGRHQARTSSTPAARPAPTRWSMPARAASPSSCWN